jgi:uncharacterized oxidoreductase
MGAVTDAPDDAIWADATGLRQFSEHLAQAMGAAPNVAAEVARHLIGANLAGHDSHGVLRWPQYVADLDRGQLHPGAEPEQLRANPVTALFDAHRCFGHHSTMVATEWARVQAREHGIAAAAIRHSMHIGRLGEYTERLAEAGLVGIVTVGAAGPSSGLVAPFGGAGRFLSTNPWSMGVPASGRPPLVYDAATSTIAEGKARLARVRGVPLPPGTAVDAEGRPTRDPERLYDGGSLTGLGGEVAGHKGHGLSLASALIGSLAMISDPAPTPAGTMRQPDSWGSRVGGVFVIAIDPAAFGDPADYTRQAAAVLDALDQVPPAPGVEKVLVPGDPERASRERRQRDGIPVPATVWRDLDSLAQRFGLTSPHGDTITRRANGIRLQ